MPVADITLSEELRFGRLIGAAGDVLYILHNGQDGRISAVSTGTGEVTPLAVGCSGPVVLSPDGRHLAYATGHTYRGPGEVTVVDLRSRRVILSAGTTAPVYQLVWSQDGLGLAVSSHEGLLVVSVGGAGGQGQRLLMRASTSDGVDRIPLVRGWTADGGGLVYQWLYREVGLLDYTGQWVGQVYRYDVASGVSAEIACPDLDGLGIGTLAFSPRARRVACAVGTDWEQMSVELCALAGDAAEATVSVTGGYVYSFPLQWSPDGRWLLLAVAPHMTDPYDPNYALWIRRILYPPHDTGFSRLWAYDTETGELGLLPVPEGVTSALWSEDGAIYYMAAESRICGFRLK